MFFEQYGLLLGALVLAAVTAWAFLLGRRASASVRNFREDGHRRFTHREGA